MSVHGDNVICAEVRTSTNQGVTYLRLTLLSQDVLPLLQQVTVCIQGTTLMGGVCPDICPITTTSNASVKQAPLTLTVSTTVVAVAIVAIGK